MCERITRPSRGAGCRPCWEAAFHLQESEGEAAPTALVPLLISGVVAHYVRVFFPSRERKHTVCQHAVSDRPRFMACPVFGVSCCPRPVSEGSVGLPSHLPLADSGRMEATLSPWGCHSPVALDHLYPELCVRVP